MESELRSELRASEAVLVDLTELGFIDSSGIGALLAAFRTSEEDGCRMHTVIASGSQVERVFKLARIDTALPLYLEREEAMTALERPAG